MQLLEKLKVLSEDWTRNGPHKISATRVVSRKITHVNVLNEELVELVKNDSESFDVLTAEIHRATETSREALNVALQKGRDLNLRILAESAPRRGELLNVFEKEIDELEVLTNRYK